MGSVETFSYLGRMNAAARRLEQALELADLAEEMRLLALRRKYPNATAADLAGQIRDWYAQRPGAELGDAEGRSVALPRVR